MFCAEEQLNVCMCASVETDEKQRIPYLPRLSSFPPPRCLLPPPFPLPTPETFPAKKKSLEKHKKTQKTLQCCIVFGFFIVERHFYKEKMVKNTWCACLSFILLLILCVGTIALSLVCSHVHLFSRKCKDQFLTCWHCFWCNGGIVADEGWGSVDIGRQVRGEADRI